MSHFSSIKVHIKNREILAEVLGDLGYTVEKNAQIRGYEGKKTQAEFVIRQPNGYDLGFRRNKSEDDYELIADFWGLKINQTTFLQEIIQQYAYKTLLAVSQEKGFNIEEEEIRDDGTIRVVIGKWI